MNFFLTAFVPFALVCGMCPFARRIALSCNIVDMPGGRKAHAGATPLLGGVVIFCGILAAVFFVPGLFSSLSPVLAGAAIITAVGLVDDVRKLSARFRLFCQLAAASLVIISGKQVSFLPSVWWGDALEILVTCLWIIGLTNAYNYLDGLDGLAVGSAVINAACFGVILYATGQTVLGGFAMILAAACLGFLPYNLRRKKMFLGDAGSTLLGFLLACLGIAGAWAQDNIVKISIPVLILGVPIFDMIFTTIMRVREGKVRTVGQWLMYGGRDHFHHYLVDIGLFPHGAVVFIYALTFSLGLSAIMMSNDAALEAFLSLLQAVIIFGVIATLILAGKRAQASTRRSSAANPKL